MATILANNGWMLNKFQVMLYIVIDEEEKEAFPSSKLPFLTRFPSS